MTPGPVTMRHCALLFLLAAAPHLRTLDAQDAAQSRAAAQAISPAEVRRYVFTIAADSMRGRALSSPELEATAQYIADEFRRAGVQPAGDARGYLQRFAVEQVRVFPESSGVWATGTNPIRLTYGHDFLFQFNDWADWNVQGDGVLLLGSLGGAVAFDTSSVAGQVLLIPGGVDSYYPRIAHWHPSAVVSLQAADSLVARPGRFARPVMRVPGAAFPMISMAQGAIAPLLAAAGIDSAAIQRASHDSVLRAVRLPGAQVHVRMSVRVVDPALPANVVGMIEGSDPALRNEYVVLTAHMDHVGIGPPIGGDSIYNGADDNASGTAAVLAVAKAFARLAVRPRRSVVFALVSPEEGGARGSQYFLEHGRFPASDIVANLNADMVGRNSPDTIVVVGRHDSDLGRSLDHVMATHRDLGLTPVDSSTRAEFADLKGWSDHASFIQKGIPFLYFYSGMHADYHGPGDSPDKINYDKLARLARMMFYTALEVANAEERPSVNKQNPQP